LDARDLGVFEDVAAGAGHALEKAREILQRMKLRLVGELDAWPVHQGNRVKVSRWKAELHGQVRLTAECVHLLAGRGIHRRVVVAVDACESTFDALGFDVMGNPPDGGPAGVPCEARSVRAEAPA